MIKKALSIASVLLIVAALVSIAPAYAGRGGPGGPMGYGGPYGPGLTAYPGLNLTADQVAKIRALDEQFAKETKPIQDKLYSKSGELRLLWMERSPDQQKINAVQAETRALRDQLQDKATAHRLAVFNVLTPEQRDQVQMYGGRGMHRRAAWR
ncbi:MAG: zinc resistance protein [Syntrophaceae bacterium PtaU1.Bin231]|nr:MAG: zinc resistance protein [Syntrophaceae bacterium PtaU1.Bin231]